MTSDETQLPKIQCHRAATQPRIDGRMDAPVWENAEVVALQLHTGGKPRHATTVRVLWDDDCFYIGFDCEDPQPTAKMTHRDDPIWQEGNVVEFFIDPPGKAQTFYEFELNPLNTLLDLFFENRQMNWRQAKLWDAQGIRTAVHIRQNEGVTLGWSAAFAIPWMNFHTAPNLPPHIGDTWRINFYRYDTLETEGQKDEQTLSWSQTGLPRFDVPERFGWISFV